MESLLLSCRALASPTTCRFIPAHGCPGPSDVVDVHFAVVRGPPTCDCAMNFRSTARDGSWPLEG
jgi:hypothetical protein